MRKPILCSVLRLPALSFPARADSAVGTLTENGKTVHLRAAVATGELAAGRLRVALLPFAVTRDDISTIRTAGALFVAVRKPSPDPARWPKPPFAVLVIEFDRPAGALRPERVRHYELHVSWLDRMNRTLSVNRNDPAQVQREFSELRGDRRAGAVVRLGCHGAQTFRSGEKLRGDFRVSAEIRPGK